MIVTINVIFWTMKANKRICVIAVVLQLEFDLGILKKTKRYVLRVKKWLEESQNRKYDGELLEEIIDDSWSIRIVKPWDINDFERENAVDNVLLWD